MSLTDTQAVILSAACSREGGLVLPVATDTKGGALNVVLASLMRKELIDEVPADPGAPVWRADDAGNPLTLRATPAAYALLGIVRDTGADGAEDTGQATNAAVAAEIAPTGADGAPEAKPERKTRAGSKQAQLIEMLRRPEGASIAEIVEAFSWESHTARGVISGALKKKLGLQVTSEKTRDRGRVYFVREAA